MHVTMIGAGRVGLVAAACLADFGIKVHCVDKIGERIDCLRSGGMPFQEPGLAELVHKNVQGGRLCFSTNLEEAVDQSLVLFIIQDACNVSDPETMAAHSFVYLSRGRGIRGAKEEAAAIVAA